MKVNVVDAFLAGARKGWTMGINNMLPNILLAFTMIEFLKKTGLLDLIGVIFGPMMGIFGLPGVAVTVLATSWLAMGAGVGVTVSLFMAGSINATHATILMPAIYLMGAQLNYMGRCLGLSEMPKKYWPLAFGMCIVDAVIAMFIMRFFA